VDIQAAIEDLVRNHAHAKLLGILSPNSHEPPALAQTLAGGHFGIDAGPLQHDEIDVGETVPARCLKNGLRLSRDGVCRQVAGSGSTSACRLKLPSRPANAGRSSRKNCSASWSRW
jgi:hypothetical protein